MNQTLPALAKWPSPSPIPSLPSRTRQKPPSQVLTCLKVENEMSSPHLKSKKVCVYCGSLKNLTRDHVPPKCLFATPPQNAITVPSCRRCNVNASRDDEYFRLILANRRDVKDHPEASEARQKSARSLRRPKARGLTKSFLGGVKPLYIENELGVIEPWAGYHVDLLRIERVASRIVKGLFWNETGKCLPREYEVLARVDSELPQIDQATKEMFYQALKEEPRNVGREVFKYWFKATQEDKFASIWILLFYESISFFCFTDNPKS